MYLYYLIPFDPTAGVHVAPKYVELFPPGSKGIHGQRLSENTYLQDYYIARFAASDDLSWMAGKTDIHPLTRDYARANEAMFASMGVDVSGLTPTTPDAEVERRLVQWLTGKDTTMQGLFDGI